MSSNTYKEGADPAGVFSPLQRLGFFGPIFRNVLLGLAFGAGLVAGGLGYDVWGPK